MSRAIAWESFEIAVAALHATVTAETSPPGGTITADLARAAALSGAAINLTRTTAAHALSYGLTGRLGLPHGLAVALHMRWLLKHNAAVSPGDCRHPAGAQTVAGYVADLEGTCLAATGGILSALLERMLKAGGEPTGLADLALDRAEWVGSWTDAVNSARARNNPRLVTAEDVHDASLKGGRDD